MEPAAIVGSAGRGMELAQRRRAVEGHGGTDPAGEDGGAESDRVAGAAPDADEPDGALSSVEFGMDDRAGGNHAARSGTADCPGSPQGPGRATRVCRSAREFHYLGWSGAIGENLQYTVTTEAGQLLACMVFGSAAWKCRARDEFIGWSPLQKQQRLHQITNNTRFLILPWVRVPHLASWILGQVLRRLSGDWETQYGHRIALVETFVDRERFAGTCYKAANWIHTGATTGRSRQDREHTLKVPVKDVYLYPLDRRFRQELCG